MMAARGGHILTVKLLLDEGADATLKNGADMTAIDFARAGGFNDIVEGLTYRLKKAGKK
jgi:ankyrin repeat protein